MKRIWLVLIVASAAWAGAAEGGAGAVAPPQDRGEQNRGETAGKGGAKEKDVAEEKVSGPLGAKTNPVRCEGPRGERQYLSRLRCPDGEPPQFSRIGSFGAGPYGNILDGYRVKCEGSDETTVFMDMYHRGHVEREAVPGFTIVD
ncbi:MAG TPA: hypothetical protein VEY09_15810 [Pyrinomonadaceae bacterium]|nr:hypothetical protein [Pyrinomonadaceae bacterium]